jgi:hypothetical protein
LRRGHLSPNQEKRQTTFLAAGQQLAHHVDRENDGPVLDLEIRLAGWAAVDHVRRDEVLADELL